MVQDKALINKFELLEDYFFGAISSKKYSIEKESVVYITDIDWCHFRMFLQRHQHDNPKAAIGNLQELFAKNHIEHWVYVVPEKFHTLTLQNTLLEMGFNFEEQSTVMIYAFAENKALDAQNTLVIEYVNADNLQWLKILQEAFGGTDKTSKQYSNALISASGNGVGMKHFIGLQNDKPVAAITLTFFGECVRIDNVATHPDYQRLGYGSQLVRFGLDLASSRSIKYAFLEASSKGLRVYKRLGFKEMFTNYIYNTNTI